MDLTLKTVSKRVIILRDYVEKHAKDIQIRTLAKKQVVVGVPLEQLQPVEDIVSVSCQLCQRHNDINERQKLWFSLLDRFTLLRKSIKNEQKGLIDMDRSKVNDLEKIKKTDKTIKTCEIMHIFIHGFIRGVLRDMMGNVQLQTMLAKLIKDHQGEEFSQFRETIQMMLDTYSYEKNILKTANRLLSHDLYGSLDELHKKQTRALMPRIYQCGTCHGSLLDPALSDRLSIFVCGHIFHDSCMGQKNQKFCPLCQAKAKDTKGKKGTNTDDRDKEKKEKAAADTQTRRKMGFDEKTNEYVARLTIAQSKLAAVQPDYTAFENMTQSLQPNSYNRPPSPTTKQTSLTRAAPSKLRRPGSLPPAPTHSKKYEKELDFS